MNMDLKLTLNITVDDSITPIQKSQLVDNLNSVAMHAVNRGLITGGMVICLDSYDYHVSTPEL